MSASLLLLHHILSDLHLGLWAAMVNDSLAMGLDVVPADDR